MANINLAPGSQYLAAARKRRRNLFGISILIFFLLCLVWAGLWYYNQRVHAEKEDYASKISAINLQIAALQSDAKRVILFEHRLNEMSTLIDQHKNWDPILQGIEKYLPSNILINDLALDSQSGVITLSGSAPDADQVAQALASLHTRPDRPTPFRNVLLGGISTQTKDGGGAFYAFDATLQFDPTSLNTSK